MLPVTQKKWLKLKLLLNSFEKHQQDTAKVM